MFHTPLPSVILYCHIPAAVSVKNWLARCKRICCRFMHPTATIQQLDLFINATDMSIISLYTVCEYHWRSVPITFYLSRDRYIEQNCGIIDCLLVKSTTYSEQGNYQLLIDDLTHIQNWLFFIQYTEFILIRNIILNKSYWELNMKYDLKFCSLIFEVSVLSQMFLLQCLRMNKMDSNQTAVYNNKKIKYI